MPARAYGPALFVGDVEVDQSEKVDASTWRFLSGALMQGVTRNPLADPGLLGVSAGASLAVVVAITWFGATEPAGYIWFALAGAVHG